MPPEWASRDMTIMAWPVRSEAWLSGLGEARDGYVEVANGISGFEKVAMIVRPRITSYNVCYTKLLRGSMVVPATSETIERSSPTSALRRELLPVLTRPISRITSYNVCYTKLLRFLSKKYLFVFCCTSWILFCTLCCDGYWCSQS